jgi:hypothetical protein
MPNGRFTFLPKENDAAWQYVRELFAFVSSSNVSRNQSIFMVSRNRTYSNLSQEKLQLTEDCAAILKLYDKFWLCLLLWNVLSAKEQNLIKLNYFKKVNLSPCQAVVAHRVETSRLSHFVENQLTDDGELITLTHQAIPVTCRGGP